MAYNPYNAVNAIYKLKGQWDSANNAGDDAKKNKAATDAQKYYAELRRNGYGSVADELSANDYAGAKRINDYYAKTGRTATRPYLYSLGQSMGLSQQAVDDLISWDDTTGEVSFGGKKIGTPDAVADGVSYWNDPTVLDSAFTDYVSRSGLTRTKEKAVDQENEALFKKYTQEYEDLKETNPFTTEEAKSILAKYDLAGLQARDNEAASGGADNSGNIDSFAAANALRQQTALVNQGQQVVLQQYQQKLDHARNLLSDMGVNIDRVYNQDENSKNNQVSRDVATSEVTGKVPSSMLYSGNPFFNADGTLKDENIDYKAEIEKAVAAGNTELANQLRVARGYKIFSNYGKYGQYADGDYSVPGAQKTETARQFDEKIAQADRTLNAEERMNTADNANAIEQIKTGAVVTPTEPNLTAAQAVDAIKKGIINDTTIGAFNYHYKTQYTTANPPVFDGDGNITNNASNGNPTAPDDGVKKLNEYYETKGLDNDVKKYLRGVLIPLLETSDMTETELRENILANSQEYDLETSHIKEICKALGVDSKWVDDYKNSGWFGWGSGVKEK